MKLRLLVPLAGVVWLWACGPSAWGVGDSGGTPGDGPATGDPVTDGDPTAQFPSVTPWKFDTQLPQPYALAPLQTQVQTYELRIPEATLQQFYADVYTPEQPATFVYNGQSYPVMVRLRGASARTFPKKSWNVDFGDLRFEGREELNLVAEYQDQTLMVEKLAYDVMEAMHLPVPGTKYVRVLVNGKYEGVFLDIEEVDKKWVHANQMADPDPSIYRCGSWDCEMKTWKGSWQGDWQKQSNTTEGREDLNALLRVINFTPEPQFPSELRKVFELDAFIRLMAAEAIIANNYVEDAESYYLSDRVTHRWYYVPWDLNNSDARWWPTYGLDMTPVYNHPLFPFTLQDAWLQRMYDRRSQQVSGYEPTFDNLRTRILLNPELRAKLLAETARARRELLDPALLSARIDQMYALLQPLVKDDPYWDQEKFARGPWFLKEFVTRRYAHVDAELQRLGQPLQGLVIDSFDPAGGWIQLANRGNTSVSTDGLVITTYLRRAVVPSNVPSKTLAPGETLRLGASQLGLTFAAQGEVGLFNGKSVAGVLDALYYGALPSGQYYARDASTLQWTVK